MRGLRVFVTGGAGVIGLELIPRLISQGADVLVGDLKPRPEEFPANVRYRHGDLNELTLSELERFAPEVLIHLAATFERSSETLGFWGENYRHNVELSHHLMTLARQCESLGRVVFASSYLIYDPALYQFKTFRDTPVQLAETDSIRPRSLTGMAKLSHEMELQFLSSFEDCRFSTLAVRIFRGYGRNSRDVISRWVRSLLAGKPITVYRPEGIFDYIYAADSAEGLLRLAAAERATGIVNLGTGRARRVADVVALLRQHFPEAQVDTTESDIPYEASEAATERLRALVNWVPKYGLEDAIPKIIEHERERLYVSEPQRLGLRNVLVTSASRKAPLLQAMKDALSRIDPDARVIAADVDPGAPAQHMADDFWAMPDIRDLALDEFIAECKARGVGVVFPTRDGELAFWAQHQTTLAEAGIAVQVSTAKAVERCLDKLAFANFGEAAGLPVIPSAETPDSFGNGPFVVKERFGAGARFVGLELSIDQARAHAATLEAPLFQPFVAGVEISIDGWLDRQGQAIGVVLRRRDRVVLGESQVTTTFRDSELEAAARKALERFELSGPVVMQAILGSEGLRIIEVNPRFGGASTLAIAAGLDMLYWSLVEAFSEGESPIFRPADCRLRQVRLPTDIVLHDPDF